MSDLLFKQEFDDGHDWNHVDTYHYQRLKLAEDLLLPKADMGEIWAIESLLKLISDALEDGARINKNTASYLSKALLQLYQGKNANLAFGIARTRGQKNTRKSRERDFIIACYIAKMQEGTLLEKCHLAANKFHVSFDTADKAWKKNQSEVRRLTELDSMIFLG
jgi:hypothetical protein